MNPKQFFIALCFMTSLICNAYAQVVATDTLGSAKSVAVSPAELLRGEVSGVRVSAVDGSSNGLYNVHLRGLNTMRGDSQPLWIVDGVAIGSAAYDNLDAFYLSGGLTANNDRLPDYSGRAYTSPIGNFGWLNPYDIESIEVIKDVSATSLYGMRGANGVIIVKTRKPEAGEYNIHLNSNIGVGLLSQDGDAFRTDVLTTHNLGVSGVLGANSFYNISAFMRYNNGAVKNSGSTTGGLSLNFETSANSILQFGINSRMAYGDYLSASGVNFIGSPSMLVLARYPDAFSDDTVADYIVSHEDETIDYRTVNSVWLNINLLRTLKFKVQGGLDYQSQTRYIWYGKGTSFGNDFNGAASILNNSLLNYNLKGELAFERSFAVKHHLKAVLAYEINGDSNSINAMCGTEYTNPTLKAKGMTATGSIQSIRRFMRSYASMGGYASVAYDYDGCAGVRGAARYDYTLKYDRKGIWMPSVEAFVDLRKMLMKDSHVVSALKLDGGYGWAGREKVLPYQYLPSYISDVPEIISGTEPYYDGMNRLISKEYNVGVSAGFLRGRYNLSVRYYDKRTSDMFKVYSFGKRLVNQWIETKNWQIIQEHTSTVSNNGFELDADFRIIDNKDFKWTANLNASYNINRLVSLDAKDTNEKAFVEKNSFVAEFIQGGAVAEVLGKNTLPKVLGGFGTAVSLYGFTVQADFSAASGYYLFNAAKMVERGTLHITEGDLEKGDYLRLDNLAISYDVPLGVRWIKSFKINLSAHNLFTLTGYSGWNPDVNSFGVQARSYGVDYGSFPLCRQIMLGVNFRF